jgi:hypothetical protein
LRRPNTRSPTAQTFGYSFFVTVVKAQLSQQVITQKIMSFPGKRQNESVFFFLFFFFFVAA